MGIIRKVLGPKSKYDKSLPYTYMAKLPVVAGDDEIFEHYYADTICGLVEYLDEQKIEPSEIELFSLYQKREIKLDINICLDKNGTWLQVPQLCAVLENYYEETKDERYKGHVEKHDCSFEDRDTQGDGPY